MRPLLLSFRFFAFVSGIFRFRIFIVKQIGVLIIWLISIIFFVSGYICFLSRILPWLID
ncbi:hypothetical protein LINPERHAP2_LOCUS37113 [Linum perenne]